MNRPFEARVGSPGQQAHDKELRAKRDPFVAHLKDLAEEIFLHDGIYRNILGQYAPDQRAVFFDVVANFAGMREHGQTTAESAIRHVNQLGFPGVSEGNARLLKRLKRVGMSDINLGMLETAGDILRSYRNDQKDALLKEFYGEDV